MNQRIDARGLACPQPVILTKKEIDAGNSDFIVMVDNTIAVSNLERLASSQGFHISVQEQNGEFCLHFTSDAQADRAPASLPDFVPSCGTAWAVLIAREGLGEGSEELGKNLLRMFLYTLTQGDSLPKYLLFLNGGVKLAALDEQVSGHIKELIGRGVEVLVCGTCLNYYEIADKLQAGTVSNMYDILQAIQDVSKVVSL